MCTISDSCRLLSVMTSRASLAVVGGALFFCLALVAGSQGKSAAPPDGFPFSIWLSHKEVTQIPWRFGVGRLSLRSDFRRAVSIGATIQDSEFEKDKDPDLVLYVRALESGRAIGPVFTVSERDQRSPAPPEMRRNGFRWINVPAIMQPGRYNIEVALLDRATGRYNTSYENVAIPGNSNDALERALAAGAQKVEFLQIPKPGARGSQVPPVEFQSISTFGLGVPTGLTLGGGGPRLSSTFLSGSDSAGIASPAPRFPIDRPGVLKLSVISVLSPPENRVEGGMTIGPFQNNLLGILTVLTRFDVLQGASDLTAIDLSDRSRPFDGANLKDVSVAALRQALAKERTGLTLDDLRGIGSSGQYLRSVLAERLHAAEADASGATHAIIVAGARTEFPDSSKLTPIPAARDCHCKVFYVRFALIPNEKDDIPRLISAYAPRVFEPLNWSEFRDQFSTIYENLRR